MAGALSPVAGRSNGADDVGARMTEALQARQAEIARQRDDRSAATADRPAATGKAESLRAVEVGSQTGGARAALFAEARSMLAQPQAPGPAQSARLIGQLLDALRSYERRPGA